MSSGLSLLVDAGSKYDAIWQEVLHDVYKRLTENMSNELWGVGIPTLYRQREIALNNQNRNILENMSMATKKKAKRPQVNRNEEATTEFSVDSMSYAKGWDEGYAHALRTNKSPQWQHNGSLIQPGLYVIEDHDGNTKTATFFETTYGIGDARNDAGFMSEYGDKVKPHLIRRVYGPISPFNAGVDGCSTPNG